MKCNCMYNLFSLLYLTFRTVNESSLGTHSVILRSSCKTSTCFGYFTRCFIDSDYITCNNFLFLDCLYHFLSQIVDCLHLCCFKCYFTCFRTGCYAIIIDIYLMISRFIFKRLNLQLFNFIILFSHQLIF